MSNPQTTNTVPVDESAGTKDAVSVQADAAAATLRIRAGSTAHTSTANQTPRIDPEQIKFWPVKWIFTEEFWKSITVNVVSTVVIAIFATNLIYTATLIEFRDWSEMFRIWFITILGLICTPLSVALVYMGARHIPMTIGERLTMIIVTPIIVGIFLVVYSNLIVVHLLNMLAENN